MSCSIIDCNKKHEAHGLCKSHYNKAVRDGEIIPSNIKGRPRIYTDEERKEKAREKARLKYKRKIANKPPKEPKVVSDSYAMYANAKNRSKAFNIPFNISLTDIIIPSTCPLLNIPLFKVEGKHSDNSPTLDRIIPSLGYVKGNVQVISMRANRIKDNSSFEEFQTIYKNWLNQIQK